MADIRVIFFDLGDTLVHVKDNHDPLGSLEVIAFVPALLQQLKANGFRLGIISNTGENTKDVVDSALQSVGILQFFEDELRIYSADPDIKSEKPASRIFRKAAERAGLASAPERCLFVANEDEDRKAAQQKVNMQVCAEPGSDGGAECLAQLTGIDVRKIVDGE